MMTVPQPNTPTRDTWALLAGMRFLLAYSVFTAHLCGLEEFFSKYTLMFQYGVYAAVPLFFVISGYSIAASLDREKSGYFERRVRRIYPVYLLAVIAACLPYAFVHGAWIESYSGQMIEAPTLAQFVSTITLTHAFWGGDMASAAPLWTLGLEWAFYMVAPLLVKVRTRYLLAVIAVSACVFWWTHISDPYGASVVIHGWTMPGSGFVDFAWLWILGFVCYRLKSSPDAIRVGLLAPLYIILAYSHLNADRTIPTYAVLLCAILLFPRALTLPKFLRAGLNWLGDVSYPLYALHYPVVLILDHFAHLRVEWAYPVIVLAVSAAVYHLVDKPLRHPRPARSLDAHVRLAQVPAAVLGAVPDVSGAGQP